MIKTQYPFIDETGKVYENLIKTWTDDETKMLLQVETGEIYDEAIDVYPCAFHYEEVDKPIPPDEEETQEE